MVEIGTILVVLVVILFSMVLHELAHGLVAYWLGDDTAKEEGRLTLNPLKHLDPVLSLILPLLMLLSGGVVFGGAKPVPINTRNLRHGAWGMALVAIAGPLTNFVLALVSFLLGFWTGGLADGGLLGVIFWEMVLVNLGFGIFNLIPVPPLDGSRVLYALAPDGVRQVMEAMEGMGIWLVFALVVLFSGVVSNLMLGGINAIVTAFYWLVGVR